MPFKTVSTNSCSSLTDIPGLTVIYPPWMSTAWPMHIFSNTDWLNYARFVNRIPRLEKCPLCELWPSPSPILTSPRGSMVSRFNIVFHSLIFVLVETTSLSWLAQLNSGPEGGGLHIRGIEQKYRQTFRFLTAQRYQWRGWWGTENSTHFISFRVSIQAVRYNGHRVTRTRSCIWAVAFVGGRESH